MSSNSRLIFNKVNRATLRTLVSDASICVLKRASSGSVIARATKNTRSMNLVSSTADAMSFKFQKQQQYQTLDHLKRTIHRKVSVERTNSQRRSMVTITQTKSSDIAPLFMDDVSSSSSASPSTPTYIQNEDTTLIVTESCLKQVERLLKQRREKAGKPENYEDGYFLRVYVDAGGCSGFQYQFEVDNDLDNDDDSVVIMAEIQDENDNTIMRPRVVVDEASMAFLEGSTIDYVIEMIKSAFVVSDNPQSESACGCGSSFAMKNFAKFGAKN